MLLYLDNCCFNRPYDDQSHTQIFLETQAKLHIQESILTGQHHTSGHIFYNLKMTKIRILPINMK